MEVSQKKKEIVIKKANDHWAFLEDIEAPMWADLTLEDKSGYVEINDDEWFNTTHPFHQWSARELKSKFAHSCDEVVTLGVDSQGLASPVLPSSVSKSRGKDYNNKKWEGINLNVLLDKQKGLGKKGVQTGFRFGREMKPKSKPNVSWPNGLLSAKLGLSFQCSARGNTMSVASCSNLVSSSSSIGNNKMGESSTRSTITSENTLQQQDYKEVSSQPCDEKSKSSSVKSVSFGRSCVTGKASRIQQQKKHVYVSSQPFDQKSGSSSVTSVSHRKSNAPQKSSNVEMDVDSMKSRGRKSSSGKSSVGSCSNLRYEVSKQLSEKISKKKDDVTMNLANKNRSKISAVGIEGEKAGNRMGNNISFAKPACNTTTKSLVKTQSSSRATLPGKINKKNSSAGVKEKLGMGKENAARNVAANQSCNEKGVPAGFVLRSQRTTQHSRLQKADITAIAASTKLGKGKDQPETKNSSKPARRIYLR